MIDFLNLKINGKFATNGDVKLTGGIGSRITAEMEFIIHWEALGVESTFFDNYITSNDGTDYIAKGFKVGDSVTIITDGSDTSNDGNYIITGITNNTLWFSNVGSTSGAVSFTTLVSVIVDIHGTTPVTSIDYLFGLVENSSTVNYLSLIDSETQKYRRTGLVADGGNTYTIDPFTVNKSWISGTSTEKAMTTIEELGIGNSGASYGYEQYFKIIHVFHITPEILDGWEDSDGDIDVSFVTWLNGANSLKFIPKVIAGFSDGSDDHNTDTGNLSSFIQNGDVGFYDEYRNGGAANYTKGSVVYTSSSGQVIAQLSKNDITNLDIIINKVSGSFTDESHFDIYVFELPDDPADYSNNTNDVWTNFEVSNVFINPLSAAAAHNKISNADAAYVAGVATISFDFAASGNDKRYIIFIDTGALSNDEADNDHHPVLIDYNQYEIYVDVREILRFDNCLINEHSTNNTERAYTDAKTWVEDGVLVTFPFDVKRLVGAADDYTCTLIGVTFSIDAEHQTDSTRNFNLEEIELDIPENLTRDFQLPTGDPKNHKKFNELIGDADYRSYLLEVATKIRWEEWVTQSNADADFVTPNANWSNYDLPPDWKLYINIIIECSMINSDDAITETYQRTHKTILRVKNYEQYEGCEKLGDVETYNPATNASLNGKLLISIPSKVKGIFTGKSLFPCIYEEINSGSGSIQCDDVQLLSGSGSASYDSGEDVLSECPEYYGILEIDIPNAGGPPIIRQISTLFDATEADTPWIGPIGTNKAKLVAYPFASPPRIEVIANIDPALLDITLPQYKLTARLGKQAETICKVSIMGNSEGSNSITDSAIDGFTLLQLLVFASQAELTCDPLSTVVGDTFTANRDFSGGYKICCSKDAVTGVSNPAGEFTHASLIGKTLDDFIIFRADNGREMTTQSVLSINSGTGTISGLPASEDIKISFHVAFIQTAIISQNSITTNLIIGYTVQDVMIFINGRELTHMGATISGNVITLPATVSGAVKICKVNQ